MNTHLTRRLRSGVPARSARAAALLFLLMVALSLPAQHMHGAPPTKPPKKPSPATAPASPATAGRDRATIVFEGTRIVFPKDEADVVEQLKPALRKFREDRRQAAEVEAKEIVEAFGDAGLKEQVRRLVTTFTARPEVSPQFDARWEAQGATVRKFADAWRQWTSDISELQLWRGDELIPFRTQPDGQDNAEGYSYRFPQVSFGKNGSHFAIQPPFLTPLFGLDITLKLPPVIKPIRMDLPLFYKPGASPEEISKFGRTFLEELPPFMHGEPARGLLGLSTSLPRWMFENMVLGEVETGIVAPRTARETALADAIARILLFAEILRKDGEQKTNEQFAHLFPFGIQGWDISDPAAILRTLEKVDPLTRIDREHVTERLYARNLIALTLLEIAQKDSTQSPILHKFKKSGVKIPIGGFTMETFVAAVDTAYENEGLFERTLAAKKALSLEQLRQGFVADKAQPLAGATSPRPVKTKVPATTAAVPDRQSAEFEGLTITYPAQLKAAVEIVGPDFAQVLAGARAAMETLTRPAPGPDATATVADADATAAAAALRAYGLEPNVELLGTCALMLEAARDTRRIARWLFSGDRIQIWIKEDMMAFLRGGGIVPDFKLAPGGEKVTWSLNLPISGTALFDGKDLPNRADGLAQIAKKFETAPRPDYPIILTRSALPAKMDDPAAVAAAIRAGEGQLIAALRLAREDASKASSEVSAFTPLIGQEQAWFVIAHEVAEAAIIKDVIQSADRRWFCDGLANWIAIQEVDRRYGAGHGAETFAKNYTADEMHKHAAEVHLLAWPTAEDIQSGARPEVDHVLANYYFATLVMQKACQGQDAAFVKTWLTEIRKTPLNRANAQTVLKAYQKLTGQDLEEIIREVVK